MSTTVIEQISSEDGDNSKIINMVVRSNERGATGEQGPKGDAATIEAGKAYIVPASYEPAVMNVGTSSNAIFDFYIPAGGGVGPRGPEGPPGKDGAIQYTAGTGINISDENVISATGGGGGSYEAGHLISSLGLMNGEISVYMQPYDFFETRGLFNVLGRNQDFAIMEASSHLENRVLPGTVSKCFFLGRTGEVHPSPSSPITPKVVSGTQTVTISVSAGAETESQTYSIPLGSIELNGVETGNMQFAYEREPLDDLLCDQIVTRNGLEGWWIEKKIEKVTFDGSSDENWVQDGLAFYIELPIQHSSKVEGAFAICDHFYNNFRSNTQSPTDEQYRGQCWGTFPGTGPRLYFMPQDSSQDTVAAFKTWLSTNQTTVRYLKYRNDYTYTQITDADLVSAMNILQGAFLYSCEDVTISVEPPSDSYMAGGVFISALYNNLSNLTKMLGDAYRSHVISTETPTTATVGVLGQLYTDTTNMHTYQCTGISGNTYTWTQRW